MKVYMQVSPDKYELPIVVAGSASELARIAGVAETTVLSAIAHYNKGERKAKYIRVEIEDDEQEE